MLFIYFEGATTQNEIFKEKKKATTKKLITWALKFIHAAFALNSHLHLMT